MVLHTKKMLRLLCLTLPQREQCSNVRNVLQAFEQGDEMQEFVVGGVADPAFNGDGVVCGKRVSNRKNTREFR
jgi:hypothetical protein